MKRRVYSILSGLLCIIAYGSALAQEPEVSFERLSQKNGLSHNNVCSIMQDRKGYLWFGTYAGINRYDGNSFKVYKFAPGDSTSLANNHVICMWEDQAGIIWAPTSSNGLCSFDPGTEKFTHYPAQPNIPGALHSTTVTCVREDRQQRLWVGTLEGLSILDRRTGTFTRYAHDPADPTTISSNSITWSIFEDTGGTIWIATWDGLNRVDSLSGNEGNPEKMYFTRFLNDPHDSTTISGNQVTDVFEDHDGVLWIGTANGLNRLNREQGTFTRFLHDPGNPHSLSNNQISTSGIAEDQAGNLWIATHNGLNRLNVERTRFTAYYHHPQDPGSISSNQIDEVFIDRTGILWTGTEDAGINKYDPNRRRLTFFQKQADNPNSLSNDEVKAIHEGSDGMLWIGTADGLNQYDRKTNTFTHYGPKPGNYPLQITYIQSILEDRDGNLWIGMGLGNNFKTGLSIGMLNRQTGRFQYFSPYPEVPKYEIIFTIYEDRQGLLWFGTANGIKSYDRKRGTWEHYPHVPDNPNSISDYWARAICEDPEGNIWVGTGNGLTKLNPKTRAFTYYRNDPRKPRSISYNEVHSLFRDSKNNLWIGTDGGGLNIYHPDTDSFTTYTERDGLPDNAVHNIIEDEEGNLWLNTNKGLCRFSPENQSFTDFDFIEGAEDNYFVSGNINMGASFRGRDGSLYFGGKRGFTIIHPRQIRFNSHVPPVLITEFRLFDQPLPGMNHASRIHLNYDQNGVAFEFAALNFTNAHKNQYAYRLEPFDPDWIYSGSRRYANYTNLNPGTYTFRVKGSNNDGIWNTDGTAVTITILPPWWQTGWAYGAYALAAILALVAMRRAIIARERLQSDLKLQRMEAEKMHELDKLKSRFFANISHEFRTPLTLILSPLERFLDQSPADARASQLYRMMYRNGQRLLQLINQLLDLSKLEAGQLKLEYKPGDLELFLKNIIYSFQSLADEHQIRFTATLPPQLPPLGFDADKLDKILVNLLANAFKFTPEGGSVSVQITLGAGQIKAGEETRELIIRVTDTGVGISQDEQARIFERFYQVDSSQTREREGSGIGLALTRELVLLHQGTIAVESELHQGALFTVCLPLPLMNTANKSSAAAVHSAAQAVTEAAPAVAPFVAAQEVAGEQAPLLLLAEDNADVRAYLHQMLAAEYRILEAVNGMNALDCALASIPDLIISDIMMPAMDGLHLCEKLKTDERTSHIPVILLTAKADEASKLQGLETGADEFLIKPFNASELQLRVRNLIEQRKKLRERFSRQLTLHPSEVAVTSTDQKFLQRALAIVETHMADGDFDVETFSREIGMSRGHLHRKLTALVNQSPSEFIRSIRLKRAAHLLSQQAGNVSEVSFLVGFNSVTYFIRCFREMYGQTPNEYAGKHPNISLSEP